ncbi:FAD linked oxidase, N-terminal [Trema orientale]|uniref:FAD linked oxidase, N-terminal n=1 Tax=Trema orientale TaxID=63057 RepID=A0A2P5FTD3_TREOI|nr:FAD linked oxidase, N-terminal [Trema orientale]
MSLTSPLVSFLFFSLIFFTWANSTPVQQNFVLCMSTQFRALTRNVQIIYSSDSPLYQSLLESSQQNPRWLNSTTLRPLLIITPFHESEIQAAVICSRKNGLQVRVRSGGHDYEGLSYLSKIPFIIIDLINLRSIDVNLEDETAWVQSGATLGELYYAIAKESKIHGFPAGICPSVGIGGHFSGGGFGTMLRKFGLAADNVIDAYLVDPNGKILDRKTMGEDLFWAIRGGGGGSFGIVLSWKIKLVRVPPIVTGFTVSKTVSQGASWLVHRWQYIVDQLPEDLFIRIIIQDVGSGNQKTVKASFNSLFLGRIDKLIPLMNERFPELGLQAQDCIEMGWIQSVMYFAGYQKDQPLELLLDRVTLYKSKFKAKSDFVKQPIPESGLKGIWERLLEEDQFVCIIMDPLGGKMNEIPESEAPFPHRKGNLYNIQYLVKWDKDGIEESKKHVRWIRMLYWYMRPYVSSSPRAAYVNYRDLDLGTNNRLGKTSFEEASVWGTKYFKGNFERLIKVKSKVDPDNFFRNEQSIPPFQH